MKIEPIEQLRNENKSKNFIHLQKKSPYNTLNEIIHRRLSSTLCVHH